MTPVNGIRDSKGIVDDGLHLYIYISRFEMVKSSSSIVTGRTAAIIIKNDILKSWPKTKSDIFKVHCQMCGITKYYDIRNNL